MIISSGRFSIISYMGIPPYPLLHIHQLRYDGQYRAVSPSRREKSAYESEVYHMAYTVFRRVILFLRV